MSIIIVGIGDAEFDGNQLKYYFAVTKLRCCHIVRFNVPFDTL